MFEKQNNRSLKELLSYILLCCAFLALTGSVYGQGIERAKTERKIVRPTQDPFRKNQPSLLQGDFAVIGNTNQYYTNYNAALDNTQPMSFVDIDNDPTTVNSSMAELKIPGGANTKIVYAGLYWVGTIPKGLEEVDVTVDNKTWTLNKRKVKLKHAKNSQYYDLVDVEEKNYRFNNRGYRSLVDITDIIQENGEGDYYVANIASDLKDNEEKITGWGIAVVYSNESMPWRYINFTEVLGTYSSWGGLNMHVLGQIINKGDIHLNIGYIVGGATKVYDNDYLIFQNEDEEQFKLSHSGNSEDNFFNGSIYLTDSKRLPKYENNAGMDIGMIEVPNPNNTVIKNGNFSYGITPGTKHKQEIFTMAAVLSSVETFVVDVLPENFIQSGVVDNGTVGPGQEMVWDLTIRNVGGQEEATMGEIKIPIPPSLHYISSSIDQTMDVTGTVTWTPPVGATSTDSSKVPGGTLVWEFDDVPLADINKVLGKLTYKLKVVDCTILSTTVNNLMSGFDLNGTLTIGGANYFNDIMESPLVKTPGTLENRNFEDFSATFSIPECPDIVNGVKIYEELCTLPANVIARAKILGDYPPGTKFYSVVPGTANYEQSEITGDFAANETGIMYYAIAPGFGENHYMKLSAAYKGLTSTPIVQNEEFCISQPVILHNQPSQAGLKLYYFDSATATTPLANPPAPTTAGVHTYYVAEGELIDGTYCLGPKKAFTLTGTYCAFKSRINPNFSIEKK